MSKKTMICIRCPIGCMISVDYEDGIIGNMEGYACNRGKEYVKKEITNPTRTITSTVKVEGGTYEMVSVKTESDIPKDKIFDCIYELRNVTVKAPVHIGDVIVENISNTGVSIIATKNIPVIPVFINETNNKDEMPKNAVFFTLLC